MSSYVRVLLAVLVGWLMRADASVALVVLVVLFAMAVPLLEKGLALLVVVAVSHLVEKLEPHTLAHQVVTTPLRAWAAA